MLRTILIAATLSLMGFVLSGQTKVGDNTLDIDPASILELESTSKGFLPSRMTSAQRDLQTEWDRGHIIYNTTDGCLQIYSGSLWECIIQGPQLDSTIYKYDGILTSRRHIRMNGSDLSFDGSGDSIIITSDGRLGIGDLTPDAKLDVEGGTVKFSDYGTGTIIGSEEYLLGVDSEGNIIETSISDVGTDSQSIDTLFLRNDSIFISITNDGEDPQGTSLAPYLDNTDNQTIDVLSYNNANGTLSISLEDDNEVDQTVDLGDHDWYQANTTSFATTISQNIFTNGSVGIGFNNPERPLHVNEALRISRGSNTTSFIFDRYSGTLATTMKSYLMGVNASTVGTGEFFIADYGTNVSGSGYNQILTFTDHDAPIRFNSYGLSNMTGTPATLIAAEADGDLIEIGLDEAGTDNQLVDQFFINPDDKLLISLEDDDAVASQVDLTPYLDNTDEQTIDSFKLTGNILNLSLEGDGEAPLAVDLSPILGNSDNIYNSNGTLDANRTVTLDGNNLLFSGTTDVIIESDGDVGIGTSTPAAKLDVDGSFRLSAFDDATYKDTSSYLLGVKANGDVVKMNYGKNAEWFYAPAVTIDASELATDEQIDIHQEYIDQFTSIPANQNSTGAIINLPTYEEDELEYIITFYDNAVLDNITVSATGILEYDVIKVPFDNYTIINVIIRIK